MVDTAVPSIHRSVIFSEPYAIIPQQFEFIILCLNNILQNSLFHFVWLHQYQLYLFWVVSWNFCFWCFPAPVLENFLSALPPLLKTSKKRYLYICVFMHILGALGSQKYICTDAHTGTQTQRQVHALTHVHTHTHTHIHSVTTHASRNP